MMFDIRIVAMEHCGFVEEKVRDVPRQAAILATKRIGKQ